MSRSRDERPSDPSSRPSGVNLRRMRWVATGALLISALVWASARALESRWQGLAALRAFAEAATIGGCADWFAIVALFRHPFGLPIPHTALVPRNKDRIAHGLAAFVADNFLAPALVAERLHSLDLARHAAAWLADPVQARRATRWIIDVGGLLVAESLHEDRLIEQVGRAAGTVPLTPVLLMVADVLKQHDLHFLLLDRVAQSLETFLTVHDADVQDHFAQHSKRWIPRWVDQRLSARFADAIRDSLRDLRTPTNRWRAEFDAAVGDFLVATAADPSLTAAAGLVVRQCLADPVARDYAIGVWSALRESLTGHQAPADDGLPTLLIGIGRRLAADADLQMAVNRGAIRLIEQVVIAQRHEIGAFIVTVIGTWDSATLAEKLEQQVGADLQYIRLSGTLVGGLVGLALYLAGRLLG